VFSTAVLLVALLIGVPLAGAGSRLPTPPASMTVTASPGTARARAIRLELTLRYVMQCDYPGGGPLVVTFPSALKLPRRFAAEAVRLAGKPVAATVGRRQVAVRVPPHGGVLCDLMGPGSLTLTFTRAARLANPPRSGSYHFTATHAHRVFRATLAVKPAR
jgi:hypothetical protein